MTKDFGQEYLSIPKEEPRDTVYTAELKTEMRRLFKLGFDQNATYILLQKKGFSALASYREIKKFKTKGKTLKQAMKEVGIK